MQLLCSGPIFKSYVTYCISFSLINKKKTGKDTYVYQLNTSVSHRGVVVSTLVLQTKDAGFSSRSGLKL